MTSQNPYAANQSPDLSLARTPDVASGSSLTSMPVPPPSLPRPQPVLQSNNAAEDLRLMGIVDNVPFYDLNLAGVNPLPNPPYNTPQSNHVNAPTFTGSDYAVPSLKAYDLQAPGIDPMPALTPDPPLDDLLQFDHPHGLDMLAASTDPLAIDPMAPDLSLYDRPDNLTMPNSMMVDPTLPDLQHPTLTQQVHMPERPADLSENALTVLHSLPTYTQLPSDDYEKLYMTQTGNNATRERHMGMLMLGLDRLEDGA